MHSLVDISFLPSRVYTANGAEQGSLLMLNRRQLNCAKCNNALYARTNAVCIWFYSSEFRSNEYTEREEERETQANETRRCTFVEFASYARMHIKYHLKFESKKNE